MKKKIEHFAVLEFKHLECSSEKVNKYNIFVKKIHKIGTVSRFLELESI
jgi:hypothetical protein